MSRYSRLERTIMDALAHDLRAQIPDLAGQFDGSRPSQRVNSGFGLFTEMIVDRAGAAPSSGPTGDLGTVHAMVGSLPDPVAFKARVRHGVLLGLLGDSYGQDTRAIDFATVTFNQVFTVDGSGRSISFETVPLTPPSPVRDLQRRNDTPRPTAVAVPPAVKTVDAPQQVQKADIPAPHLPTRSPQPAEPVAVDQMTLLIGLWALIGVTALLLVFVFQLPFAFGVFFALIVGRTVKDPKVLARVRKVVDGWTAASTGKD